MGNLKLVLKFLIGLSLYVFAVAIFYSQSLRLLEKIYGFFGLNKGYPILMYHRVLDSKDERFKYMRRIWTVSKTSFKKQVEFLKENYQVLPYKRLLESQKENIYKEKICLITFDDGSRDNYEYAYPILKEHGLPATIFLITDRIAKPGLEPSDVLYWLQRSGDLTARNVKSVGINEENILNKIELMETKPNPKLMFELIDLIQKCPANKSKELIQKIDKLARLTIFRNEQSFYLDWKQIDEMMQNGISFGSHTVSHLKLSDLSEDEVLRELRESKETLEKHLEKEIDAFSYPRHGINETVKKFIKVSGYKIAFFGSDFRNKLNVKNVDFFHMKRIPVYENAYISPFGTFSKALFALNLSGFFNFVNIFFTKKVS